ncbi:MAG: VIT1/CCC1 transporter family protein [Lysobacterales bacterium]
MKYESHHRIHHTGWLRAAVMGANDGIVSTASLVVGVAAAAVDRSGVLVAGVAGLVAGAMSMAAGEYVSVSSQADTEKADLEREQVELDENEEFETRELTHIYQRRGLDKDLARQVAVQLMKHDALAAHARDELGISETVKPRPLQAGLASAATFAVGALLPLLAVALAPASRIALSVTLTSLLALTGLGILSARVGGAPIWTATARIVFWGALAMAITAVVGRWFGTVL